jgi:hypothetical protein
MGSSTGWHLPREYTVVENAKKEKNGKMDPKKWSKSPKMDKNGPKWQKDPPSNSLKLSRP